MVVPLKLRLPEPKKRPKVVALVMSKLSGVAEKLKLPAVVINLVPILTILENARGPSQVPFAPALTIRSNVCKLVV